MNTVLYSGVPVGSSTCMRNSFASFNWKYTASNLFAFSSEKDVCRRRRTYDGADAAWDAPRPRLNPMSAGHGTHSCHAASIRSTIGVSGLVSR